ncbi:glycosyltransferase [Actinomyces haliotis]|uniref:glycosyltransferase n=1 Tax=Actinomyces haliotis TaxID=1280843 RepID=UPI00188EFC30|nr:glycosyltransferase [Actinomyces haliotis]
MTRTNDQHEPATPRRRLLEVSGSAAGGVRAHLGECARLLSAEGHDVVVEAPAAVLTGLDLGAARSEALEVGPAPRPSDALAVARLRRLGRRADVVHAHGLRAGSLAALALGRRRPGRTRLVVTLHNRTVGSRATRAVGERLEALIAARADAVLAVSPDIVDTVRERGAAEIALAVIPAPAARTDGLAPTASSVESAWPGAGRRVLTVARLAPQKGLDLLLDAAVLLTERGAAPMTWAVAGEGPLRDELETRIRAEHLPARLLGRREDVGVLMEAADVVVQTSLWEGQPLTVQEALRVGAAVVATDVGGTAVTARGGAVLVEPEAVALADAVAGLLADDAALTAARSRSSSAAASLPGAEDLAEQLRAVLLPTDPA